MISREQNLALCRQREVVKLSRSSIYYEAQPVPAAELAVITSKSIAGHKIYPYLLRDMQIDRPNHLWAMDIAYILMAGGFVYLAPVVDCFTQRVRSWRLLITMEVEFCIEAVAEALANYRKRQIFNTDQGSQFTSAAFIGLLLDFAIAISMDSRVCWRCNVFGERLWRSVKYEEAYLNVYDSVAAARNGLGQYLLFYNTGRLHSSLDGATPVHAYFNKPRHLAAA